MSVLLGKFYAMRQQTYTSHKNKKTFITAYHSVWASQPMQLDAFWKEEKIIIQKLAPCSTHVKKAMFIVSQILPVNNPQQILVKVILITPLGSVRGNRRRGGGGKVGHKSHGNPSLQKSLLPNHLLASFTVVTPTSPRCLTQRTHLHTKALSFNLHASVLCKHRSDHTHWAVSLALIRLFVLQFPPRSYPCFVHCHSSGIMGCFHHAGTSTEAVGEMQRRHVVLLLSSHIVLSSHAIMNATVWSYPQN